jgi:hypothetical protein
MRATAVVALLISSAFVFGIGCKKDEAPASGSAPAADPDSTGVAECDDYFKQMKDCFATNPAAKAAMEGTMTKMRETFKAQVQAPGGKEALKTQCQEHIKLLGQNPMCAKK